MKYCTNCGTQLNENVKFCPNCGKPTGNDESTRKQVFAGKIIKCPNCGTEIANSYVTKCPGCGYELGSTKTSDALDEFKNKILEYDRLIGTGKAGYSTWGTAKKIGFVILCFYTVGIAYLIYKSKHKANNTVADLEKEKKIFIEQYTFPNDRESLLDALIFVKDRLYSLSSDSVKGEDFNWAKIWINKAGHIYQKLEMLYPNDKIASDAYQEANKYFELVKKLKIKRTIIICLIIVGIFVLSYVYTYLTTGSWSTGK